MPATFHGGPLHGLTVDVDLPQDPPGAQNGSQGAYRLDGASFVWDARNLTADEALEQVHVRPAPVEDVQVRPERRKVTRR